ncbi:MAG: ATP-binding cassette domain-containing protein [Solirubrobacterales bacterium]|nr:ATP-binding cassette domain-containing protein [Solirubrobacterales bacterium]
MSIDELASTLARKDGQPDPGTVILAREVNVFRWSTALKQRVMLLEQIDWQVERGEHWVMLGPNGAGKTTLLHLAAADSHPSGGTVEVLGRRLGATDMRALREDIGLVDARTSRAIPARRPVLETVESGAFNSIALQHQRLNEEHLKRAGELLEVVGLAELATRAFGECSQGERQRVLLARALMPNPDLLLLDEPASGLDLPSREQLVSALSSMAGDDPSLTTVTVTHHLEEIPPTSTHALLIDGGRIVSRGPIAEALTSESVSACFGLPIEVRESSGRWSAAIH